MDVEAMKLPWRLMEAEGMSMEVDGSRWKSPNIAGYCGSFRKFMEAGKSNGSSWTRLEAEKKYSQNSWK